MEVATTRNTFLILVAAVLAQIVTCEIVPLSLILDPDSTVVHYVKGKENRFRCIGRRRHRHRLRVRTVKYPSKLTKYTKPLM